MLWAYRASGRLNPQQDGAKHGASPAPLTPQLLHTQNVHHVSHRTASPQVSGTRQGAPRAPGGQFGRPNGPAVCGSGGGAGQSGRGGGASTSHGNDPNPGGRGRGRGAATNAQRPQQQRQQPRPQQPAQGGRGVRKRARPPDIAAPAAPQRRPAPAPPGRGGGRGGSVPLCPMHHQPCVMRVSGPQTRNPGRAFLKCAHPDPDEMAACMPFEWADEWEAERGGGSAAPAPRGAAAVWACGRGGCSVVGTVDHV